MLVCVPAMILRRVLPIDRPQRLVVPARLVRPHGVAHIGGMALVRQFKPCRCRRSYTPVSVHQNQRRPVVVRASADALAYAGLSRARDPPRRLRDTQS